MTVQFTKVPAPRYDQSLVPAYEVNFDRIRQAFNQSLGGIYQTAVANVVFAAVVAVQTNLLFPFAFTQATGPCVLLTPIDNGTFPGLVCNVDRATNAGFIFTITAPFAITGTVTARWVAFYP